jgi:hypothetical protein
VIHLCSFVPVPYSRTCRQFEAWATENARLVRYHSVGQSLEGRPIPCLTIADGARLGKKRVVIVSGEHAIEFPGVWSVLGIAEYLVSGQESATRLLSEYVFDILPHCNPDGNVLGRGKFNAAGTNMCEAYGKVADGCACETCTKITLDSVPEARAIWDYLSADTPPFLHLNFHGWRTLAVGREPYEGGEVTPDDHYPEGEPKRWKRILDREFSLRTHGASWGGRLWVSGHTQLGYQLAKHYGTFGYGYEPNMRTGVQGCKNTGAWVLLTLLNGVELCEARNWDEIIQAEKRWRLFLPLDEH